MKARHERKSYHNTSDIHSQKREFIPNNEHPLNILITNHHLLDFTGSEVFTFTLADFLKRAGHNVTIYSNISIESATTSFFGTYLSLMI